ncbi:MAG TPA: ABC transporter substrate-binding protein [Candidatus Babeliales bacterium]|nr:ABC transporter substrate-binding protein [Candidatus Babeliales bacterium]
MYLKKTILTVTALTIVSILAYTKQTNSSLYKNKTIIGILQTASHPALDAARDGFIAELKNKMDDSVEFIIQNAQGSVTNAHTIAQRFHINKAITAIYAIATPAAQAMATIEKDKPIIVAAMTDTQILGEQNNIYGVTDMIDMHKQIEMIHLLLPHAQTIAVLYNTAELNSIIQLRQIKQELNTFNIALIEVGIHQESDIPNAVSLACRKADAIICPTDNMLACAMSFIATTAYKNKKPLFACYNQAVEQGALAARGVDYAEHGKRAGYITHTLLTTTKDNSTLPIEHAATDTIYVNAKILKALELIIPESLQNHVILIEEKQ